MLLCIIAVWYGFNLILRRLQNAIDDTPILDIGHDYLNRNAEGNSKWIDIIF